MRGTMITMRTDGTSTLTPLEKQPALELLKDGIGGGYIELIPGWDRFPFNGSVRQCVAFCDEDGKRKQLPRNDPATAMWHHVLKLPGQPALREGWNDYLVGDVVVIVGDEAFMRAMREDGD